MDNGTSESRNSARKTISFRCPCRIADGAVLDLELQDLSVRGFKARMDVAALFVGQAVTIYPEGLEDFHGTVRRAEGEFAGIEFDRELPAPVYERLLCNYAPRTGTNPGSQTRRADRTVHLLKS